MKKVSNEKQTTEEKVDALNDLKNRFMHSQDLIMKQHSFKEKEVTIVYFDSLVERQYLDKYILSKLEIAPGESYLEKLVGAFQAEELPINNFDKIYTLKIAFSQLTYIIT